MYEYFNKEELYGREMPLRVPTSSTPLPFQSKAKAALQNFKFSRQPDVLETIAAKKMLHQRLSNHTSVQELSSITDSISNRADFERKLNLYFRKHNNSQILRSLKKDQLEPSQHRRHRLNTDYSGVFSRKVQAPVRMKNPKRLVQLPSIHASYKANQQKGLNNLAINREPLNTKEKFSRYRHPVRKRRSGKFFQPIN